MRATVSKIAIEWLQDSGAEDRQMAAMILRTIDQKDAIPAMVKIIETEGRRVGQVNGLAVIKAGMLTYGFPARITST